jgi:outer membrane protein assembly factor BamB
VVGPVLYATSSVLWAIRASDGAVLWKGQDYIDGELAYANGLLYTTSANACVLAVDARTGGVQWRTCPGGEIDSTPTVVGGQVFFATRGLVDGTEYALEAATGSVLWTADTQGENFSSAAAAYGLIYLGTAGGTEYAFPQNCVTPCQPVWTFKAGNESGHFPADASVANGVVYTGTVDNTLIALDAMTGTELWITTTDRYFFEPAVVDGVVYAGTADGHLDAFSLPTGS